MNHVATTLLFIGMVWVITFIAVLLCSLPAFFSRRAFSFRRFVSPPGGSTGKPFVREPWTVRRVLIVAFVGPFALSFLVVFGVPLATGLAFVAFCVSFRRRRYLAYRALRRRRLWFALLRSYYVGFTFFVASLLRSHRPASSTRTA